MGHSALISATEHAIKLARKRVSVLLALKTRLTVARYLFCRDGHQQRVGCYCNDANRTCVAPHGGAERFLGTNPIALVSRWKTAIR